MDILDNFDDIENVTRRENAEQVRDLSDKDLTKSQKCKLLLNSPPEVKAVSSFPSNESIVLCDVCSLQGISEDKDSAFSYNLDDTKFNITTRDCYLYCSEMESFSRRNTRPTRSETGARGAEFKTRSSVCDDKEQRCYPRKDFHRTRISKDNEKTAACFPLLFQTSRQEKAWNLSENRKISKGRKQGFDTGTVNGKKLPNSIAPEYHNLRPYLPLLRLCQCPDYDSAVIEVVRDCNDPCRGVASLIYPASNP